MTKTLRLYDQDPYLLEFEAVVLARRRQDEALWIALDQTAFYAEGGGQPADHGTISGLTVSDVQLDDQDVIWHKLSGDLDVGERVLGQVDATRRVDHREQHTGQHILSQAFWRLFQATTVGFHLGEQVVTIDLSNPDLSTAELGQAEDLANTVIRENRSVYTNVVEADELPTESLRKLPKVTENIRLVHIDGFDMCGCGGTHVSSTGEIGLLKIISCERRRGNLRVYFLAGGRAYRDYTEKHAAIVQMSTEFSLPVPEVASGVIRLKERMAELEREMKLLKEELLSAEADKLLSQGSNGFPTVVSAEFRERSLDEVKVLAGLVAARKQVAVAFGLSGEPYRLLAAASDGLGIHIGNALKQTVQAFGGKGGGAPQAAQGAVPAEAGLQALTALRDVIMRSLNEQ